MGIMTSSPFGSTLVAAKPQFIDSYLTSFSQTAYEKSDGSSRNFLLKGWSLLLNKKQDLSNAPHF